MSKRVDYLDMSIPFDDLPMPKTKAEWKMFKKRHKLEFVKPYEFMSWYDCYRVPFFCLRVPLTDEEKMKFVERFESEYTKEFRLSPIFDPEYDDDVPENRTEFDVRLTRALRKRMFGIRVCKAAHEGDIEEFRLMQYLLMQETYEKDDGENIECVHRFW